MEPNAWSGSVTGSQITARSLTKAEQAAGAWAAARDRQLAAMANLAQAQQARELAEDEERKAWSLLLAAAERDVPPSPSMPSPTRY